MARLIYWPKSSRVEEKDYEKAGLVKLIFLLMSVFSMEVYAEELSFSLGVNSWYNELKIKSTSDFNLLSAHLKHGFFRFLYSVTT